MGLHTNLWTGLALETEVLVIGGGLAGLAAACAAAEGGKRVTLIDRRTYLGGERTAALRAWFTQEQHEDLKALFGWNGDFAKVADHGELPLVPDLFKCALEDRLLAAGVELLYGVRPIGIHRDGQYRVEVAGKFGRGEIRATIVIDATEQAVVARQQGAAAQRPAAGPLRLWRTLELTGVDLDNLDANLEVPAEVAPACRLHRGHAAEHGHLLVEHAWDTELAGSVVTWRPRVEAEARFATMRLARWLKENHPAFAGSRVATTSYELTTPPLWRVKPHTGGLWVASGCSADLADEAAQALADDPVALARLGWEIGRRAYAEPAPAASMPFPQETRTVNVLVIGGGTSGASASIGAARGGASTLLVEMSPGLGGAGTLGGVDSYWFGRKGGFNQEVSRWVAEQHAWMKHQGGRWNIEGKMIALLGAVREAGVEVLLESILVEVRRTPAGRVTGALIATPEGLIEVQAKVTIDATGDGDVAVQAGAPYIYGSDREGVTMWYSMIPYLRPGLTKNNWTSTVNVGDPHDYTRAILSQRRRIIGHDHGPYVAPRESRHIPGAVRITLTDILTMRRWPDVINIHFSNHDVKGHNTSDWLNMGLIPPNLEVEIPYRAIVPLQVDGLLVAGKAFSATHDALPPIRMQADLENLGFVCGTAAAMCGARGTVPRELPVADLQAELVKAGILPEEIISRQLPSERELSPAEMRRWIEALDDKDKLFLYGEMEMDEVRREPIPIVMVCTAGLAIIPYLKEELARPDSPRRLHVARALAWYGDQAATPVLLAEIQRHLTGDVLPYRVDHIRYSLAAPDHGAMPELAFLLHSLAMVRDERAIPALMEVAERLHPTQERFLEHHSGVFYYVDAVCDIAERLGHLGCVPALQKLANYELFRDKMTESVMQPDYFEERKAHLEITIARALARCGEISGVHTLARYLRDSRKMLAYHAHRELKAITGQDLPADHGAWAAWAGNLTHIPCKPWTGRQD